MPEAMGINTFRTKLIAFLLAALLASIAGWFLAHYQCTVDPSVSSLRASIGYLFMTVIGGVSAIGGGLVGAAATQILDDRLQVWLPKLTGSEGHYEIIVFGILLVLLLQSANRGLLAGWATRGPRSVTPDALPRSCRPTSQGPLLRVRGLTKQFTGLTAVDGLDFDVHAGEIVGLFGPNGAGKSTTFNLITGALPPTSGTVTLNGRSVTGWSARAIAHEGLARSFQPVRRVPEMTVLQNVALGAHRHGRAGVVAAMLRLDKKEEQVLLNDAAAHLARVGLAAQMHEPAGNLSLGSRRLLEIARALSTDLAPLLLDEPAAGPRHAEKLALAEVARAPARAGDRDPAGRARLLLLDEPSIGLAPRITAGVFASIARLRDAGMTIVLVEQNARAALAIADEGHVLETGRVVLRGPASELANDPRIIETYVCSAVS
jgi:branched-chain amino acid transport system permease protein